MTFSIESKVTKILDFLNNSYRTPWKVEVIKSSKAPTKVKFENEQEEIVIYYDYNVDLSNRYTNYPVYRLETTNHKNYSSNNLQDLLDTYYGELFIYGQN